MAVPIVAISSKTARKSNEFQTRLANGWYYLFFFHAVRVSFEIIYLINKTFNFETSAFWLYGSCRFASKTSYGMENIRPAPALRATFRRVHFDRNRSISIFSGNDVNIFRFSYSNRHTSIRVHILKCSNERVERKKRIAKKQLRIYRHRLIFF